MHRTNRGLEGNVNHIFKRQIPPWGANAMVIDRWRNIFFFEGLVSEEGV